MADATGVKEYKGNASSNGVLTSGISNSALSAQISAVTLWPSGTIGNFVITVDGGLATEEKMLCSAFSGSTITIAAGGRGYDGTVAVGHSLGATVVHTIAAVDFAEANWIANYHARSSKTIPADADELPLLDSASVPAFGLVKLTWANLKAAFATLYQAARGYTTTVTAAGTTTLTAASTRLQYFTGTTTQTVVLPVTSTLVAGTDRFEMVNNSTGILTLQSSGLNTILAMAANTRAVFDCILVSGTTAASWSAATSIPPTLIDAAGDLLIGTANDTVGRLGIGTALQVLRVNAGATALEYAAAAAVSSYGLFAKASPSSTAFTITGVGTISIKAGTYVDVSGTLITFAAQTAVTMPALTAGTDYFIYVSTAGVIQAVAASGTWPTPVASPPASSRLIGGFHYAPGSNATAQAGGNTTPQINAYSVWDLTWKPATDDPRGMALVADKFWADIYLLNRDPQTNGTSKNNIAIADGETGSTTTCIIPTMFGGNGTLRYALQDWWSTAEALTAFGKRLPTYGEMQALAYGVTENQARGTDPLTTGLGTTNAGTTADQLFTSKWGIIQATGVMDIWAHDLGGPYAAAAWANNNGGRGQTYSLPNAAGLSGNWGDGVNAGSRFSLWGLSPAYSASNFGGRGVTDHLWMS
jgi:hypothetical protein